MSECNPQLFTNMNFDSIETNQDGFFASTILDKNKVFLKLHNGSTSHDNSTDIEDSIYTHVEKYLKFETPHLMGAIQKGSCDIDFVLNSISDQQHFMTKWELVRGYYLFVTAPKSELDVYTKQMKTMKKNEMNMDKNTMIKFLKWVFMNSPRSKYNYEINYFVTPSLPNLVSFMQNGNDLQIGFDLKIAIQVAQALSICDKYKIMHNNLLPQNIFIMHEPDAQISYEFSIGSSHYDFVLKTDFVILIGGYEYSFYDKPNLQLDKLCKQIGKCNNFVANLDWFTFLSSFTLLLEHHNLPTQLRTFIGGKHGQYIDPSNPCIQKPGKNKCVLDLDYLDTMVSPLGFIIGQKETNPSVDYEGKIDKPGLVETISSSFSNFFNSWFEVDASQTNKQQENKQENKQEHKQEANKEKEKRQQEKEEELKRQQQDKEKDEELKRQQRRKQREQDIKKQQERNKQFQREQEERQNQEFQRQQRKTPPNEFQKARY